MVEHLKKRAQRKDLWKEINYRNKDILRDMSLGRLYYCIAMNRSHEFFADQSHVSLMISSMNIGMNS